MTATINKWSNMHYIKGIDTRKIRPQNLMALKKI